MTEYGVVYGEVHLKLLTHSFYYETLIYGSIYYLVNEI